MLLALVLAGCLAVPAWAQSEDGTRIRDARLVAKPQGYYIEADLDFALNRTLTDALEKGVHLHFVLEADLRRPRSWWFDEDIGQATRRMRLYYHLLLRRYVAENGYTTRTVPTLAEALAFLGQVDDWPVLERGALKPGRRYEGRLRIRLDTSKLPRAISLGTVTSDKWDLAAPRYVWTFEAPPTP